MGGGRCVTNARSKWHLIYTLSKCMGWLVGYIWAQHDMTEIILVSRGEREERGARNHQTRMNEYATRTIDFKRKLTSYDILRWVHSVRT